MDRNGFKCVKGYRKYFYLIEEKLILLIHRVLPFASEVPRLLPSTLSIQFQANVSLALQKLQLRGPHAS